MFYSFTFEKGVVFVCFFFHIVKFVLSIVMELQFEFNISLISLRHYDSAWIVSNRYLNFSWAVNSVRKLNAKSGDSHLCDYQVFEKPISIYIEE